MSALPDRVEELLDSVDAAVFSGDAFCPQAGRERFEWYLGRWQREMNSRRAADAEEAASSAPERASRVYVDRNNPTQEVTVCTYCRAETDQCTCAEADAAIMRRIEGLYVGMLSEEEEEALNRCIKRGTHIRDYGGTAGFLGLSKVKRVR